MAHVNRLRSLKATDPAEETEVIYSVDVDIDEDSLQQEKAPEPATEADEQEAEEEEQGEGEEEDGEGGEEEEKEEEDKENEDENGNFRMRDPFAEVDKEMKLLEWHKLANEAALKAALIKERAFKEQEKNVVTTDRQKYHKWIKQVELEERNKPLEVSEEFVRNFTQKKEQDDSRYKAEIERRVKTIKKFQEQLKDQSDMQQRKQQYDAIKSQLKNGSFVSAPKGEESRDSLGTTRTATMEGARTTALANLNKLQELEKRIGTLEQLPRPKQLVPQVNEKPTLTFVKKKTATTVDQPSQSYYTVRVKAPPASVNLWNESSPMASTERDMTMANLHSMTETYEPETRAAETHRTAAKRRKEPLSNSLQGPNGFLSDQYKLNSERLRRERHAHFRQMRDERTRFRLNKQKKAEERAERQKEMDEKIQQWYLERRKRDALNNMNDKFFIQEEKKRLFNKERKQMQDRVEQLQRARMKKGMIERGKLDILFQKRSHYRAPTPNAKMATDANEKMKDALQSRKESMRRTNNLVQEFKRSRDQRIRKFEEPRIVAAPKTHRPTRTDGGRRREGRAPKTAAPRPPKTIQSTYNATRPTRTRKSKKAWG